MKKNLRMLLIAFVLFAIAFLNGLQLVSAPTQAEAKKKYMAGKWNNPMCSCPMVIGDCVCEITVPD